MKRFSLRTLLMFVTIVAAILWWTNSGFRVVYSETWAQHGKIEIIAKRVWKSQEFHVRVKYTPDPSEPSQFDLSGVMRLKDNGSAKLTFDSKKASGLWCIYDTNDRHFVVISRPFDTNTTGFSNIWHPGIHIGWGRGLWASEYDIIKQVHPEMPYDALPGELRLHDVE